MNSTINQSYIGRYLNEIFGESMRLFFLLLFLPILPACETTRHYPKTECRKYIIAPPAHIDENISTNIAKYWRKSVSKHLTACHAIFNFDKHLTSFMTVNIDHLQENAFEIFSSSQGKALARRSGATHIVFLELIRFEGNSYAKPHIYTLKTGIPTKDSGIDYLMPIDQKITAPKRKSQVNSWLVQSIGFLPNTFLIGTSQSSIANSRYLTGNEDDYIEDKRDLSNIPPILSSLSFTNILHPEGFDDWDFTTRFFPSMNFGYLKRSYRFNQRFMFEQEIVPNHDDGLFHYDLNVFFVSGTFNYEFNFFTPLGTSFFTLGYGPGYSYYNDNIDNVRYRFTGFSRMVIGHRFFISERFLIQFAQETNRSSPRMINNSIMRSDGYDTFVFQVGYFFPESRSWMRKSI